MNTRDLYKLENYQVRIKDGGILSLSDAEIAEYQTLLAMRYEEQRPQWKGMDLAKKTEAADECVTVRFQRDICNHD